MKKTLIVVSIIALLGLGAFAYLGGFKEYPIEKRAHGELRLYGLTYIGTPQDEQLKGTFEAVETIKEKSPESLMYTIYEVEPAGKLDTMKVFVGLDRVTRPIPAHLEEKTIHADDYLVAILRYNKLVMPRPETVKKDLTAYAKKHGLDLQGIFIDKLITEEHVEVWAPLVP